MSWLITGIGGSSSVGSSAASMTAALCAGAVGRAPLRGFDRSRYRARYAYEIDDRPAVGVDIPRRATSWLVTAVAAATEQAGLTDLSEVPILIGTTQRELRSFELALQGAGPHLRPEHLHFGTELRDRFGAMRTYTVVNACAAALCALGMGTDLLDAGAAEAVVVAGTDSITESIYGLLDRCYRQAPDAVRPFDQNRIGMVPGDGAAAVVLRRAADGPGAGRVLARLRGVAVSCDAVDLAAPDVTGITLAMREAHRRAGVHATDIDLALLHGTGTELNDVAEARALQAVFGTGGDRTGPVATAIKSMIGHTAGASGLHSLMLAVHALQTGLVPPTVGLREPIEEAADLRIIRDATERIPCSVAQVDAFGFGGVNAVAIVAAP